jgi:uncharacterized protein (TIGR02597 family)
MKKLPFHGIILASKSTGLILFQVRHPSMIMKRSILLAAALVSALAFEKIATAQSVASDPVGFTSVNCLANSDTLVSVPFTRPPEFVGAIASAAGTTITVNGTPWTADQFVYAAGSQPKTYYALIGSVNPKEGRVYAVTANGTNTLTVDISQSDLTGIPANAQVLVIPYWTPATVFPASDANVSFTPTTSTASYQTQLRIPDYGAPGINPPPLPVYFFSNNVNGSTNNVGWRVVGDNSTDHGDDPLLPDGHMVVRNQNGAPTLPLVALGSVLMKKLTVPLITSASQAQDNPLGMIRPFGVTLNALGLNPGDGSFVANDQLLLFDNTQVAIDKAPSAIYTYNVNGTNSAGWRLSGDAVTDRGNDVVPEGSAMVVRKAAQVGAPTVSWTNAPLDATNVGSRKTHGVTPFDARLIGNVGIESRSGGASNDYQLLFTFPNPVTFSGAAVTAGTGSVTNTSGSGTNSVTVNLTGVTNAQKLTLSLQGVNDGTFTNDVAVRMGVLVGDVGGNGTVNASDIAATKAQSGQAISAANFRTDVAVSGSINASDIAAVKSRAGTTLPP